MCVQTFFRTLRTISVIVLFFFLWTFLPLWQAVAWAAEKEQASVVSSQESGGKRNADPSQSPLGKGGSRGVGQTSGDRFEKALEGLREHIGKVGEKHAKGQDITAEIAEAKKKRGEIEAHDIELRKEFAATEKKLKDANLPKEILDRHHKFVKHYEANLSELKGNLDGVDKAKNSTERAAALQKVKSHLEKVKTPSRHQKLDPNNLPFQARKVSKGKEPRLKKEEFEKDFPPQRSQRTPRTALNMPEIDQLPCPLRERTEVRGHNALNHRPIMFAFNEFASDVPFTTQLPSQSSFTDLAFNTDMLYLLAAATPPTVDDLAETIEVQFTQDIRDLASQLNNSPVKIYEWVRNNIEFVPTYGSIQGADMCLQSRQCNAMDTASLLIALLRVSNLPAHYVYGTVEIPIEKAMNWVGGFTDPIAAASFIASGGIPGKMVMSGTTPSRIQMEHVWVETYIPYGNYRGAIMDQSNKTWIPMDGSYKQYTYTTGYDITGAVPFNQDEYMSQVQTQNPVHYYQGKIQEYLDANLPDTSIVDAKGYRVITQETYHFLPSTLPYVTIAKLGTYSSVPGGMAVKATFTLSNPVTGSAVSYTATTSELAGKRLTISYIPATSADEALIAHYGGFLYDVPAYMLHLMPVVRVEGVNKLTGTAATLGSEQGLTIQFSQPAMSLNETVNKKLIAGAYYAVGMDLQGVNENVLGKRNQSLTTNVLSQTAGTLGNDDLIGEHLHILATAYFMANDKIYKSGAKLYNTTVTRTLSESITSFTLSLSYLFGISKAAMPSGINMDVAMDRVIVIAKGGNTSQEVAYMKIAGLVSSYNEHDIFEKIDGFASVSTIRALQVASANGITIEKINASNIAHILPMLQVSQNVLTDIQNAVNAGKQVTIPQKNVQINDWNGTGYIVQDPINGSGSYMISGGLAGSDSTGKATGMEIAELFEGGPLAWTLNNRDPQIRNSIIFAADKYIYEQVDADSPEASTKDAYDAVGQCSGLVRRAYWAAGICLDDVPPTLGVSCGKSLREIWGIKTVKDEGGVEKEKGGAEIHYDLANAMKLYGSVRKKPINNPLSGDIVFFYDAAGNLNHEGIVTTAPDDQGMVEFIHALRYPGVHTGQMNITSPGDPSQNEDILGCKKYGADHCRSGQLSAGYGTIRTVNKQN